MTYAKPARIIIPTEPIGSIPRPPDLIQNLAQVDSEPGGDFHATHSADVDYANLFFELKAGNFYVALACEQAPQSVPKIIRKYLKPNQRVFVGVIAPNRAGIESAEEVRDRVLEASEYIPIEQLGTTDDCGFAPFSDDTSTSRDTAFAKIRARVLGTALAENLIGVAHHDTG